MEQLYGTAEWTNWKKLDKNSKIVSFFTSVFRTEWSLHVLPSTSNIGVVLFCFLYHTLDFRFGAINNGEIKRANASHFFRSVGKDKLEGEQIPLSLKE